MAQNVAPSFTGGATLNLAACMNSVSNINGLLVITDPDVAQPETWSVSSFPMHGSLGGFSTTMTSTGSTLVPIGLTYTPATGYSGPDTFMIDVSDGIATTNAMVVVNVRALPTLNSTLSPAAICDQSVFSYTPSSASAGATFAWNRAYTPGLSNPTASGTGSISETLQNITYYSVPVTYNYTISAGGCVNHQNVTVSLLPAPRLSSALYDTTCTTATYSYIPTSVTPGTTYTWSRAAVAGVSPATSSGSGNINEILTNSNGTAATVVYAFSLNVGGCSAMRYLNVTILPQPPVTSIATKSPASVCAGARYLNFGAGIAPPPGITYTWSVTNAELWATGGTDQYTLVSFPYPGNASVTLRISGGGAGCESNNTYAVNVTSAVSASANVIYYNSQFIYMDNTASAFQWGYDNAATLDSVILPGENFQSYPNATPDVLNRYYWVMATKDGCTQKIYYNTPVAVTNVRAGSTGSISVFPNPAGNTVTVDVAAPEAGNTQLVVVNMLGQTVKSATMAGSSMQLDIAALPAGCYVVTCTQNGVRIGVSRLIKN